MLLSRSPDDEEKSKTWNDLKEPFDTISEG